MASELVLPNDNNYAMTENKDDELMQAVTGNQTVYKLDKEWTQDIDNEYNPESFVKEYPKLKKLLQTFDIDPLQYTTDIIYMVCIIDIP